ncbi:MAG: hypothetical protein HZB53_17245 [Chloroflexi bacterium]|nr:hypothetical protein [Chloroflexota bacterium]
MTCARQDRAKYRLVREGFVLPPALPGLLSVGIFSFTLTWNEFIYALVFLTDVQSKAVPVGVVSELIRADVYLWG